MRKYLLYSFITACLAYSLYFIFAVMYHQPIGTSKLADGYFYGFIVHVPAWFMALLIIGMFNQKVSKIKYLNKIINLAAFVIVVVFAVPFFDSNERNHFDYLVLFFYLFDLLFSSLIFVRLLNPEKLKSKETD